MGRWKRAIVSYSGRTLLASIMSFPLATIMTWLLSLMVAAMVEGRFDYSRHALGFVGLVLFTLLSYFLAWGGALVLATHLRLWRCSRRLLKGGLQGITCRPGTVAVRLVKYVRGGSRDDVNFEPAGDPRPGLPEPGGYHIWRNWRAWLTGCRVEEGPCRGLLLALIDPSKACSLRGAVSVSSEWGDWARAELEPTGPGLVKVKMECHLVKARSAKLSFVASYSGVFLQAEFAQCSESGVYEQVVDLRGFDEPVLFVALDTANVDDLDVKTKVAGLCGVDTVELTLDFPYAIDIRATGRVEVVKL